MKSWHPERDNAKKWNVMKGLKIMKIIKKITSEHSINVCLVLFTSLHVLTLSSVNTFAFQSLTKITTNKNSKQTCQKTCPVKCDLLSKNKLYISSQLYSGLLVINQQVKQRSVSCSSCQPPSMSFAAHLQVFDDIFVPVLNWNHLLCHLSDLCFKLSPSFHFFFITYLCKLDSNSEEIDVQMTGLVFENSTLNPAVLKPTKCKPAQPIRNEKFYRLSNQNQVILLGAITKIKEKCPVSANQYSVSDFVINVFLLWINVTKFNSLSPMLTYLYKGHWVFRIFTVVCWSPLLKLIN